jgi:hypothetical protein
LLLKLGLRVSPRTIRKYLPKLPTAPIDRPRGDQRWSTFLKNHAQARTFIMDLASRIKNRIQLTTDGHRAYLDAVD